MSDGIKKLAELLSTNEKAEKELEAAVSGLEKGDKKGFTDAVVKVAAKHGITLTAADFEAEVELSPDEMKAVAGGGCNGLAWKQWCHYYDN